MKIIIIEQNIYHYFDVSFTALELWFLKFCYHFGIFIHARSEAPSIACSYIELLENGGIWTFLTCLKEGVPNTLGSKFLGIFSPFRIGENDFSTLTNFITTENSWEVHVDERRLLQWQCRVFLEDCFDLRELTTSEILDLITEVANNRCYYDPRLRFDLNLLSVLKQQATLQNN